jgi:hypothetical protein
LPVHLFNAKIENGCIVVRAISDSRIVRRYKNNERGRMKCMLFLSDSNNNGDDIAYGVIESVISHGQEEKLEKKHYPKSAPIPPVIEESNNGEV